MTNLEDYAEGLKQETMIEMAESFFGARVRLDDEIEFFEKKVKELKLAASRAMAAAMVLRELLLDDEGVEQFYGSLGIDPPPQDESLQPGRKLWPRKPFALTRKGLYLKLLRQVYSSMWELFDEYGRGRLREDPRRKGQKRFTMHHALLIAWCEELNKRIDEVNKNQSPSCVITFAHGLDLAAMERERITGGPLENYACSLDQSLMFKKIDCAGLGLPAPPDLPKPAEVKGAIKKFGRGFYAREKKRLAPVMDRLFIKARSRKDEKGG